MTCHRNSSSERHELCVGLYGVSGLSEPFRRETLHASRFWSWSDSYFTGSEQGKIVSYSAVHSSRGTSNPPRHGCKSLLTAEHVTNFVINWNQKLVQEQAQNFSICFKSHEFVCLKSLIAVKGWYSERQTSWDILNVRKQFCLKKYSCVDRMLRRLNDLVYRILLARVTLQWQGAGENTWWRASLSSTLHKI